MTVRCTFCVHICKSMCVCVCAKGNDTTQGNKKKSTGKGVFPIPLVFFGLRCVIIFCTVCTNHSNNLFCYDIFQCAGLFRFMLLVIICTTRMCTLIYADVALLYMLTLLMWLYYAVLCVFVSYLYCTRARCTHSCIQVLPQQYFESFSFSFVIITDIIAQILPKRAAIYVSFNKMSCEESYMRFLLLERAPKAAAMQLRRRRSPPFAMLPQRLQRSRKTTTHITYVHRQ